MPLFQVQPPTYRGPQHRFVGNQAVGQAGRTQEQLVDDQFPALSVGAGPSQVITGITSVVDIPSRSATPETTARLLANVNITGAIKPSPKGKSRPPKPNWDQKP